MHATNTFTQYNDMTIQYFTAFHGVLCRSYMSARVLLNLLKQLRKSDKMLGLAFSATSFIHLIIHGHECKVLFSYNVKIYCNRVFGVKTSTYCQLFATLS